MRFLVKLIYLSIFLIFSLIVKLLFYKIKPKIWFRNSLKLDYFTPFLSDIDITLCVSKSTCTRKQIQNYLKLSRLFKKFFLPITETNLYFEEDKAAVFSVANPLELMRDPQLGAPPKIATKAEEALYIARIFQSDFKNLTKNPQKRLRKWKFHFSQLNNNSIMLNDRNLVNQIHNLLFEKLGLTNQEQSEFIEAFYKFMNDKVLTNNTYLWALFFNQYCYHSWRPQSLTPFQADILSAAVHWEFFAAYTQHSMFENKEIFPKHLAHMKRIVSNYPNVKILRDFDYVISDLI